MVKFKILILLSTWVFLFGLVEAVGIVTVAQNVSVIVIDPFDKFLINSPTEGTIYTSRVVQINASTGDERVNYIKYRDNEGGSEVTLCRNCNFSSKKKSFDDGFHNVLFSAAFSEGVSHKNVGFWVDSRVPVIRKTAPTKGFGFGEFTITFYEVNPKQVLLGYGNNATGYRIAEVNLSSCIMKRNTWTCVSQVDLADYDLEDVTYWFSVYDLASRSAFSKVRTIAVDFSPPVIKNLSYTIAKKEVSFAIDIDEPNFKMASYIDMSAKRPRELVLCRKLKEGQCIAKKRFSSGSHDLLVVEDTAGHNATREISFEVY